MQKVEHCLSTLVHHTSCKNCGGDVVYTGELRLDKNPEGDDYVFVHACKTCKAEYVSPNKYPLISLVSVDTIEYVIAKESIACTNCFYENQLGPATTDMISLKQLPPGIYPIERRTDDGSFVVSFLQMSDHGFVGRTAVVDSSTPTKVNVSPVTICRQVYDCDRTGKLISIGVSTLGINDFKENIVIGPEL